MNSDRRTVVYTKGEYILHPPTGPNHQISLTQITNRQKKGNSLITKIYGITRVWTAIFTLHSGHVENVSHARYMYIVNHQSRNFYRAQHSNARKTYTHLSFKRGTTVYSPNTTLLLNRLTRSLSASISTNSSSGRTQLMSPCSPASGIFILSGWGTGAPSGAGLPVPWLGSAGMALLPPG